MYFKETNYLIVGGTTGLGLSAAIALNKAGAKVFVIGRKEESLRNALQSLSGECAGLSGDATNPTTINKAIEMAHENGGAITGLYHVAGGSGRKFGDGPLDQMTPEGWAKTLDLNLNSLMISNKAIIEYYLKNHLPGIILNMGSVLGFSPSPKYFSTHAYAAAKSAIIGFSKSVAAYYAKDNIRVNVIAPALFETPMAQRAINDDKIQAFIRSKQPLDGGRPGVPEDTDNAALMFLSPDSKFITGQVLAVDGGWSISEGQYN